MPFPDAAAVAGRFCSETDKLSKRKSSSFGDGNSVWLCFGGFGVDYNDFCSAGRIWVWKKSKIKTDILGNPVTPIPLLGSVKSGYNYLAQENWIGTVDVETSLVGDGKDYFALKVKGDSMAPIFIEGDIVIIKKQNDCENNEFSIVIINGDEGTLKKIKKTDSGIILQPLNPAYRSCDVY